jgi:hypothetical protein
MKLQAWRTVGKTPCEDPPVYISIGGQRSNGRRSKLIPWVMLLEEARGIFGDVVDQITETPQEIKLSMCFVDEGI